MHVEGYHALMLQAMGFCMHTEVLDYAHCVIPLSDTIDVTVICGD